MKWGGVGGHELTGSNLLEHELLSSHLQVAVLHVEDASLHEIKVVLRELVEVEFHSVDT